MYAPINIPAYVASYSGAVAGMGVSGWIVDPAQAHYDLVTQIAGSFAQAFDIAWNDATQLNNLELAAITAIVSTEFSERGPGPLENPVFQTVANWDLPARACIALVLESDAFFAGQGINPGTPSGGGGTTVKISGTDTTPGFLGDKLVAGTGVTLTILNPGGDETLEVSAAGGACVTNGVTITGLYACAENNGTTASGDNSFAEGLNTIAAGTNSHSEGMGSQAVGTASHAEGNTTVASSNYSHAEGDQSQALNDAAHAEGFGSTASGLYSHAEGHSTTASGSTSHAEGLNSSAGGDFSHAEGSSTAAGIRSHAEGNGSALGDYSHAEGLDCQANAHAHAECENTHAYGVASHSEGKSTTASGIASHAEGQNTLASQTAGHAEGNNTQATVNFAHAEGDSTIASGIASHAEGGNTIANGVASHAEGNGASALADFSHAEGFGTCQPGASYSHAEGYNTQTTDQMAHAEGVDTSALARAAHAEGDGTTASDIGAHAEGIDTQSGAAATHAEGNATSAQAPASHAEGRNSKCFGENSHAEGLDSFTYGFNEHAHAGGQFATLGDNQYRRVQVKGETPGLALGESVALLTGGAASIDLRESTSYHIIVRAVATKMGLGAATRQAVTFNFEFLASVNSAGVVAISAVTALGVPIVVGAAFVAATLLPTTPGVDQLTLTFKIAAGLTIKSRCTATVDFIEVLGD